MVDKVKLNTGIVVSPIIASNSKDKTKTPEEVNSFEEAGYNLSQGSAVNPIVDIEEIEDIEEAQEEELSDGTIVDPIIEEKTNEPSLSDGKAVSPIVENNNETTPENTSEPNDDKVDTGKQEVVQSFDGELTNSAEVNYYTNKLKKDDPNYPKLVDRLLNDKSVSVYDKYKILEQIKAAGYDIDEAEAYSALLGDMSNSNIKYNAQDVEKINQECIKAFENEGKPMVSWKQWLTGYDQSKHDYLEAWTKLYASAKNDSELFEQYKEIMPINDLANAIQKYQMNSDETKNLKRLFSALPQADLNLNENEELAIKYSGLEEDYKKPKDIMKAYEDGDLTTEEVLYIFSCKYSNSDELIDAFRKMSGGKEEKYLEDLLNIMQSQTVKEEVKE